MNQPQTRRKRVARTVEVVRTEWLAPSMVRVIFTGDDLRQLPELTFTDHYVKLIFPPEGADYRWPFDPDELRERVCVGTREHSAQLLGRYEAAGCQRIYLWPLGDEPRQLERISAVAA